jgi:diacylglycerol kinase family enzyme
MAVRAVGRVDRSSSPDARVKAVFIVNERAGKKRKFDIRELIKQSDAFESTVLPCQRKEDRDAMIDEAERDAVDVVFAVGGDGTTRPRSASSDGSLR